MQKFSYIITDPVGIHAHPAGLLVKAVKALDSVVTIKNENGKSAAAGAEQRTGDIFSEKIPRRRHLGRYLLRFFRTRTNRIKTVSVKYADEK